MQLHLIANILPSSDSKGRFLYTLCESQDNGKTWKECFPPVLFKSKKEFNDWYFELFTKNHLEDWRANFIFRTRHFDEKEFPKPIKPNQTYSLRKIKSLEEL
jgi:hypothetical protein